MAWHSLALPYPLLPALAGTDAIYRPPGAARLGHDPDLASGPAPMGPDRLGLGHHDLLDHADGRAQ